MPPPDFADSRVLAFMTESFEKEKHLRSSWFNKHVGALTTAATFHKPPLDRRKSDSVVVNIKGGIETLARDHRDSYHYRLKVSQIHANAGQQAEVEIGRQDSTTSTELTKPNLRLPWPRTVLRHGHSIVDIGLGDPREDPRLARPDSDLSPDPIMRPVDPKTTEILYKDKPEFGRVQYLRKRSEEPEKRYYFAECFSWDYGWRMKDAKSMEKPKYGRFWTLKRSFSNRVGPTSDPDYYKNPDDLKHVTKCFR